MATGGVGRESVKGSDEFSLFMCSPCSRKRIDVGAEMYCIQCEEYMCGKCLNNHNSFTKMAAHTMLDRAQMEAKGPLTAQPLLAVPCDLHPGQMYTCSVRNTIRSCDVRYISDEANEVMQGTELYTFKEALKEILLNLKTVKKQRDLDMQRITEEKETEINKIHTNIQQMVKELEAIEMTAVNDVIKKFNEFKTTIERDLFKLGKMIQTLKTKQDKLEKAQNETETFVHMKISKEDKSRAKNLIEIIEAREGGEKLVFVIDEHVKESIGKLQSLGQLVLDYRYTVQPEGQHRVNTVDDRHICDITGMCVTKNGNLVLADGINKCLKRLNKMHEVIDNLKLDKPSYY